MDEEPGVDGEPAVYEVPGWVKLQDVSGDVEAYGMTDIIQSTSKYVEQASARMPAQTGYECISTGSG